MCLGCVTAVMMRAEGKISAGAPLCTQCVCLVNPSAPTERLLCCLIRHL